MIKNDSYLKQNKKTYTLNQHWVLDTIISQSANYKLFDMHRKFKLK